MQNRTDENRSYLKSVFFSLFILTVVGFYHHCLADCPDNHSRLEEAVGFATILDGDIEQAKDLALDEARLRVVKPLGVSVESKTIYSMGLKIADWNRIKAGGYIVHEEIIEAQQRAGGYEVKIRAWIKCGPDQDEMTRQLLARNKLLLLTEGLGSQLVQNQLAPLLTAAGYSYVDPDFIQANLSQETWQQLQTRQLYDLNPEAFKFMADLVVYIRSDVTFAQKDDYYKWYDGHCTLQLFQLSGDKRGVPEIMIAKSSGKLVTLKDEKNSVQNLISVANDHPNGFNKEVAKPAVTEFMARLAASETLGLNGVSIEITVTDVPSAGEYQKFLYRLKAQKGVVSGSIAELSQDQQTYRVAVKYRLKSIYLANLLTWDKRLKLTGHAWNKIGLQYHGL
jgi:hypothetical protein